MLICFVATEPEKKTTQSMDIGREIDLRTTYASALGNMKPSEHPEMPAVDAPWYVALIRSSPVAKSGSQVLNRFWEFSKANGGWTDPFPGLHLHKVNMDPYNRDKPPLKRRNLKYYSVRGEMPSVKDDPNMHVCAHLYASDRNSLFVM